MGPGNLNNFVDQFKRVLSEPSINSLGRLTRFCQRERVITPYRLAVSVLASCATTRVQTLADIQRHFNALFDTTLAYKPFHNQLAKRQFTDFMRELVAMIIERWTVRVLQARGVGRSASLVVFSSRTGAHLQSTTRWPCIIRDGFMLGVRRRWNCT